MSRRLFVLVLSAAAFSASAARPPLVVPTDPDTVLERLPRGYSSLVANGAPEQAEDRIDRLLATAASTGDARLVARADRLLASLPPTRSSARILKARAYAAQYQHDFATAAQLLDQLVASYPRDGGARLARAQLHLVTGRLDLARADCVALLLGIDAGRAQLCAAALALRSGDSDTAIRLTDSWLAQSADDDVLRRHVVSMRAETAARVNAADADAWFKRLLALAPGDVRSLVSYARYLRASGRHQEVLALLTEAPDNDTLQLQAALAANAARLPEAAELAAGLARRYRLTRTIGAEPELRDEAEFLLVLRGDAAGALALAQRNFESQRDFEDVDILARAAIAAGVPDAFEPARAWASSQKVRLPGTTGVGE
ncbi:MAG: hypothetical protein ABIO84_08975 [Lysobacter sp.]